MRKLMLIGITSAIAAGFVVPAQAQTSGFRLERVYFRCLAGAKVQNVQVAQGQVPPWSPAPPSGTLTSGSGCGLYENSVNADGLNLRFRGTFTGNVDDLTVQMYDIYAGSGRPNQEIQLRVVLTVNGELLVESDLLNFPTTTGQNALTEKIAFTFTALNYDDEPGQGSQTHTIDLVIRSGAETQNLFLWGASDVPSGLTFNPPAPEATRIVVNRGA